MKTKLATVLILACSCILYAWAQQGSNPALEQPIQSASATTADHALPTVASDQAIADTGVGKGGKSSEFIDVDVMPTVKNRVNPTYPKEALQKKAEGTVYVKIRVDKEGNAKEVQLLKSDNDLFNESALAAARQFQFTPALKGKEKVEVWITVPFKFKLDAHAKPGTPKPKPARQ